MWTQLRGSVDARVMSRSGFEMCIAVPGTNVKFFIQICLCATMVENVLEQVFACMIVNVFCNGIEQEEDGIEEVCFGIIVCAVVFLNGSC